MIKNRHLINHYPYKMRMLLFVCIIGLGNITSGTAQELLNVLDQEYPDTPQYELATFKGSRISIGHSVENRRKGVLDIVHMQRYWNIPNATTQNFIADKLNARVALEYGITDRLTFGAGGSTLDGIFDSFLKYQLVRQRRDHKGFPLSITLFQNGSYKSKRITKGTEDWSDRLAFTTQLLMARKFSPNLSLQIAPTLIHRNTQLLEQDPQTQFAIGFGGRYKLDGHVAIVSEYYYVANPLESRTTYGAFALGVNWEVKNLLLQFQLTNARNMVEDAFITQTINNFNFEDGNFVFGANATVSIQLFNKKQKDTK